MLRIRGVVAAFLAGLLGLLSVPAASATPAVWEQQTRYPVILVPGLGGTELHSQYGRVWLSPWWLVGSHLPVFNLFNSRWMMSLRLAADGETPRETRYRIQTGDVMRNGLTDAYSGMVFSLEANGWREGKYLRVFPYDWRMAISSHVDRLASEVDDLLQTTGAPQVILISHSQGGLFSGPTWSERRAPG